MEGGRRGLRKVAMETEAGEPYWEVIQEREEKRGEG